LLKEAQFVFWPNCGTLNIYSKPETFE